MSVSKPKGRTVYAYDFRLKGRRFQGSTGETSKREAQRAERRIKEETRERLNRTGPGSRLRLVEACERYYQEVARFQSNAAHADNMLERMLEALDGDKFLDEITNADIAAWVAGRRAETTGPKNARRPISNARVNRSTVELARRVWRRAAEVWEVDVGTMPRWSAHLLPEPKERVREAGPEEERRLFAALRPDYHPIVEFSLLTGVRLENAVGLTWDQIRLDTAEIAFEGKGEAGARPVHRIPLVPAALEILKQCRPYSTGAHVFTYEAQRTRKDKRTGKTYVKGRRYPINRWSLRRAWTTAKKRAGIADLRWHDLRHTAASRTLRASGNLAAVQKLLGHSRIETTVKYAHAQMDDVRAALMQVPARAVPDESPDEQRRAHHKPLKAKKN